MARSRIVKTGAATLVALVVAGGAPPATASVVQGDGLSGTWQVTRACVSGCTGSATFTEKVRPYRGTVFMATGGVTMLLDRIGLKKVLVHAARSSSLLTIRVSGQVMRGPSVDQVGEGFTVTWRCVAAPGTGGSELISRGAAVRPLRMPGERVIC